MRRLYRADVLALLRALHLSPRRAGFPLQTRCGGDPWMVTVVSVLLCRTTRRQAEPVFEALVREWPHPNALAAAVGLEDFVRPCGLHRQRARQLQRMSSLWHSEAWDDLRDLPGVGVYVADAVGLFCFGCAELESDDRVLHEWADRLSPASILAYPTPSPSTPSAVE